jgi:ATPase complex subunit ATP10
MKTRLARRGVLKEPLLELFIQIYRRPASQCLHSPPFPQTSPGSRICKPRRHFSSSPFRTNPAPTKTPTHIGLDRNPSSLSAISRLPIPSGSHSEVFTPSTLSRPLGLPHPPLPGQNTPNDSRTLSQKASDFSSKDLALERRKKLLRSYLRPYFQEWKRVDHWKGKSFVANPLLFKKEAALYFPNMWGSTLSEKGDGPNKGRDTTPALKGKISVVGIQSGRWAEEQVDTFLGSKENAELQDMLREGKCQRADINVQDNWMRALFVFTSVLKKQIPKEQWGRYFRVMMARDVGRGLTEDIRDAMGFLNSNVGYVYLLDAECRIRWAGSGHAWPGERESLNAGIRRLYAEMKGGVVRKEDKVVVKIERPKGVMGSPRVELA